MRWSEDEYTLAGQGRRISRPAVTIQLIEGGLTCQSYRSICKPKPLRVPSMNTLHACGGDEGDEHRLVRAHFTDTWWYIRSDDSLATLDWWCVILRRFNVTQPVGQLSTKGPPYVHEGLQRELVRGLGQLASLVRCRLAWLERTIGGVPRACMRRCSSTIAHDGKRGSHEF